MNKTKKVAISAGHNYFVANNFDPGAVSGSLRECDIVKATAKLLVPMLEKRGYEVLDVTPYNERFSSTKAAHTEKCRRVDEFDADLYMDIHINSFSDSTATGTEVIVYSTKSDSYPYATQIVKNISNNVGIRNRGVKINTSFYALTLTRKPAMIIEGAFISNPNDMKNFTPELYAKSIAEAFVDISVKIGTPDIGDSNTIYRVRKEWLDAQSQKGAFGNLQYAINRVLEVGSEYKVFDENGIQVYPDNIHWAKKHYDSLIDKGIKVTDTNFDKNITLGNAYKLFDELTDNINIHDELEDEVEKEPEKEIEVVEILQLEYKRALKHGMKGEDVKQLQRFLKEYGYYFDTVDGSAGNNTITAIKNFQHSYNLVVDGSAGRATYNMINEILKNGEKTKPQNTSKKSKYYKIGDAHIIETTPDNIEITILGNTLHGAKRHGVNGALFDTKTAPVTSPESCVFIAMNDGKALSNNAQFNGWNAPPRATMIYNTNKQMELKQIQNINPIRHDTIWAIGGYMVKPYMDFTNEKIPGGVNYKTAHTYIGSRGNTIYLVVKPNHMIRDIVPLANQLGLEKMICLDGGGSSQLRHPDGSYKSSRAINSAVLLKEV